MYLKGVKRIFSFYHTSFYSKHDLEINSFNRIEIKSSLNEKRIHRFKHNQLVRDDLNVYIVSILLEESKEGISLYDLFNKIFELDLDYEDKFNIKKMMEFASISEENKGIICTYNKESIKVYNAKNVPHLNLGSSDLNGISSISYDVDLSNVNPVSETTFISQVNFI